MKHIFALLTLSLLGSASVAQTKTQLKLYQNTDFFNVNYYNGVIQESRSTTHASINRFSLAVNLIGKKKLSQEIELFIPEISTSIYHVKFPQTYTFNESNTYDRKISTYAFRYEVNMALHQSDRSLVSLGAAINPYYWEEKDTPLVSNVYARDLKTYGVSLNLIPRVSLKLTRKITLDVNIPFKLYDLQKVTQNIKNPAIPIADQTNGGYTNIFFQNSYTIRLGIAYALK